MTGSLIVVQIKGGGGTLGSFKGTKRGGIVKNLFLPNLKQLKP